MTEPWDRFRNWIHAVCVVTFDLELGQAIEVIYPGDAALSAAEKSAVCYLAFPDSNNSAPATDCVFHFRLRRQPANLTSVQRQLAERAPTFLAPDENFFYGFAHFRQQRDPTSPRGYFQKSVVLITPLPFVALFELVVEKIGDSFFNVGEPAVEAACHDVDGWAPPLPGLVNLPILGVLLQARIPAKIDVTQHKFTNSGHQPVARKLSERASPLPVVLPSIQDLDSYSALKAVHAHLHILWELVLLNEPLLVVCDSPQRSSAVVHALISLIAPLRYSSDYRPYFTIHDSEFREFTQHGKGVRSIMLGVTNPFFMKALQHWPHILKLDSGSDHKEHSKIRSKRDASMLDSKCGLYTEWKPFLKPFELLSGKKHQNESESRSTTARKLIERTHALIAPLERYLSSLLPLKKQMSPFKPAPTLRAFSMDALMTAVENAISAGQLSKGDWKGLYQCFTRSPNFGAWQANRASSVCAQLEADHLELLCAAEIRAEELEKRHQAEIVELVLAVCRRLEQDEKREKLSRQLTKILEAVDADTKQLLLSNEKIARHCAVFAMRTKQ